MGVTQLGRGGGYTLEHRRGTFVAEEGSHLMPQIFALVEKSDVSAADYWIKCILLQFEARYRDSCCLRKKILFVNYDSFWNEKLACGTLFFSSNDCDRISSTKLYLKNPCILHISELLSRIMLLFIVSMLEEFGSTLLLTSLLLILDTYARCRRYLAQYLSAAKIF